jgi:hypothetical protein
MSIPITCTRDVVMYVLYHGDRDFLAALIQRSTDNINQRQQSEEISMQLELLAPAQDEPMATMRLRFFLLLNIDECMRRELVTEDFGLFLPRLDAAKACGFYDELADRLLPEWLKDESVSTLDVMERITDAYLVS